MILRCHTAIVAGPETADEEDLRTILVALELTETGVILGAYHDDGGTLTALPVAFARAVFAGRENELRTLWQDEWHGLPVEEREAV